MVRESVYLGIPRTVLLRHALAVAWSVTCNEIELLLLAGYRPAYLFPSLAESRPVRRPRGPWNGPNRQPLYGIAWMRCPGIDLSVLDPPLTEPDPSDPVLAEF